MGVHVYIFLSALYFTFRSYLLTSNTDSGKYSDDDGVDKE